jgi:hypothetical protein
MAPRYQKLQDDSAKKMLGDFGNHICKKYSNEIPNLDKLETKGAKFLANITRIPPYNLTQPAKLILVSRSHSSTVRRYKGGIQIKRKSGAKELFIKFKITFRHEGARVFGLKVGEDKDLAERLSGGADNDDEETSADDMPSQSGASRGDGSYVDGSGDPSVRTEAPSHGSNTLPTEGLHGLLNIMGTVSAYVGGTNVDGQVGQQPLPSFHDFLTSTTNVDGQVGQQPLPSFHDFLTSTTNVDGQVVQQPLPSFHDFLTSRRPFAAEVPESHYSQTNSPEIYNSMTLGPLSLSDYKSDLSKEEVTTKSNRGNKTID